jgi:flagellar basal-body rod protein FlgB
MMNRIFSGGSVSTLEAMLTLASKRHRAIAANIANVDTVGYRTRDVEPRGFRSVLAAEAGVLKANGNNVDLEVEMSKMVRNNALHSTAASLLAHQFTLLREAISGQLHS